jgi:hypothetical protein
VVFPENLDDPGRVLLGRAQGAISTVLGSRVRAAGLLGHPVDDALLSEREWEIASKLREIAALRTLHQANTAGGPTEQLATATRARRTGCATQILPREPSNSRKPVRP